MDALAAIATDQWGMFTTRQAKTAGFTTAQLRWYSRPEGPFEQMLRSVYRLRNYAAPALQVLGAALLARGPDAVACGNSAGWAHGFDGVKPGRIEMIIPARTSAVRDGIHRRVLDPSQIAALGPFRMTDALTTLLDLAATLDDVHWEWALEFGFRRKLFTPQEVDSGIARRSRQRRPGAVRARRVLSRRPANARPTGSQLETEFLQLIRPVREIPEPERQYPVVRLEQVVARLDFAFPTVQAYTEVHGGQHRESLRYDATRETMVAATLGWLESEVTAGDIRKTPRHTVSRMIEFIAMASRRIR
jgi:very-short-patch-repair endonuclease